LNNQNEDPLAMFRPVFANEKPDMDQNDPLFLFRPEAEKNKYKQPEQKQPLPENFPGGTAPWYERWLGGFAMQPSPKVAGEAAGTAVKAALSGSTFGGSELIPGLKVNREEYPEIAGAYGAAASLPAIGVLNKAFKPLETLASKSPIATKALTSLAEMTGWGLTGASEKVLTDAFQGKVPSAEDILTHGAEWFALDAALKTVGLTGKFASWVLGKSQSTKQPSWQVINDLLTDMKKEGIDVSQTDRVTAKVLSELEKPVEEATKTAKEIKLSKQPEPGKIETLAGEKLEPVEEKPKLDLATKKIEPAEYKKVSESSEALAKPYQPEEIKFDRSTEQLAKARTQELVEEVGERAATEKQFGENIKADIEKSFKESEKLYEPLYHEVEEAAEKITHKPTSTVKKTQDILEEINSLKTKPEGYQKVINTLNDALKDMGHEIVEHGSKLILRGLGQLKPIVISSEIPLSKTMELARRLNKIADYDIIGPSIKNKLKPVIASLKTDIKETLKSANPELHKKFVNAEGLYADTAKKFGTDAIQGIRGQQKAEKIAGSILEPSVLENLKKIANPSQYNEIQREILHRLRDMPFEKAKRSYREIEPFLDKKAQDAARSTITHKAPKGQPTRVEQIKTGVFNELDKAFSTGKRPEKVLDLWKTAKGQQLIKDSLDKSPNKKEILDYLKKQSFYDFASSVTDKAGAVDFKKFQEYLKDPAFVENLRMLGGEEAVSFFRSLQNMDNAIKFNVRRLEQLPNVYLNLGKKESLLLPAKGKYALGEEKLAKAAERAKIPTEEVSKFQEIYPKPKLGEKSEKIRHARGEETLKEAARKRQPLKFKLEELSDRYGFTPTIKGLLTALGIIKFTGPSLGVAASKILYHMATKQSARKSINRLLTTSKTATEMPHDITPFLISLFDVEDPFSE
jgi:hypothetical protein